MGEQYTMNLHLAFTTVNCVEHKNGRQYSAYLGGSILLLVFTTVNCMKKKKEGSILHLVFTTVTCILSLMSKGNKSLSKELYKLSKRSKLDSFHNNHMALSNC